MLYKRKKNNTIDYIDWNADDVLMSLTAWGKKLLQRQDPATKAAEWNSEIIVVIYTCDFPPEKRPVIRKAYSLNLKQPLTEFNSLRILSSSYLQYNLFLVGSIKILKC